MGLRTINVNESIIDHSASIVIDPAAHLEERSTAEPTGSERPVRVAWCALYLLLTGGDGLRSVSEVAVQTRGSQ